MILKQKKMHVLIGYALSAGAVALTASAVQAQQAAERVTITGSTIKRIASEGALPVQTISKEEIARTGASSVSELMQQLPSMQGFTTSGESVGGGGGGIMTVSLHDIGESYTLVLLNGRRLAPRGSGSTVDLNSIPLSAIERIEVLTDGASALYGSDAMAGVVNFILKQDQQGTQISTRFSTPLAGGASGLNFSASTGFGNFAKDGYNVLLAFGHDSQDQLKASERDFAKTGMISFGDSLYYFNGSGNAIPGNARVKYTDSTGAAKTSAAFNPYQKANARCAPRTSQIGGECWFDYTSTIEIQPQTERDSFFGRGTFKLGSDWTGSVDAAHTQFKMLTRIAPYPTGWFTLPKDSALANTYVKPYLTAEQLAGLTRVDARWRAEPAGGRDTLWTTDSTHLVGGLEGRLAGWDVAGYLTYAVNDTKQDYPNGWLLASEFTTAAAAGAFNVFGLASDLTAAEKTALAATVYHGPWDRDKTTMKSVEARASRPLFKVGGGDAQFGMGADFRDYRYDRTIADANANELILFLGKDDPYGLKRSNFGVFGELVVPLTKQLEVTAALRYDTIGKVSNTMTGESINKDEGSSTYKVSARFQPAPSVLFRGSIGTGFKAPSMLEIGKPRGDFGVTGDQYACPFTGADPLAATCLPGLSQYNVYTQGYGALKPERSDQRSLGFVFEPKAGLSFGMDWWEVRIKDVVTSLSEQQIFADPVLYRDLFTTKANLATGDQELAIIMAAVNAAKSINQGIDWKLNWDQKLPVGNLKTMLSGTHLLQSKYTRPGTEEWVTSLGLYGENGSVSFRDIVKLTAGLQTGAWTNTVAVKYRSGYDDEHKTADNCAITQVDALGDCVDIQLKIPSYTTVDWQTSLALSKAVVVRAGINNVLDRKPHLTLSSPGGGHQVGYDARYTDSLGRAFYLGAEIKF